MGAALVSGDSLIGYFKTRVDEAASNQGVDALELTRYYLVQLLAASARADPQLPGAHAAGEPLALRLGRALQADGSRQRAELRRVGDASLFVSGFFPDSLRRRLVDVDYYATLGGYAYGSLSDQAEAGLGPVFGELAARFLTFADVLSEVSEATGLTSDTDLLRLYERWAHGSARSGQLLARHGVVPNRAACSGITH